MASPVPSGSNIYSYVWQWWDGVTTATVAPFTTKVVNIGGQPGTDELHYSCRPVAVDGQNVRLSGTLSPVNGPPTILQGVSISANDGFFAFQTRLQLQAIDQDGDSFDFAWYTGGTFLGNGTTSAAGLANGTWSGNDTTIIASYPVSQNHFDLVVASSRIVTCYVVDDRGGTSSVSFSLRGEDNPPPQATVSAGIGGVGFDAASPPTARIGTGQFVDFTVYVAPVALHTVGFLWTFSGSTGWTMPPVTESGTTTVLANGGYQNTVHRDISVEVVSSGTQKVSTAHVRVTATNILNGATSHTDADYVITLVANSGPSSVAVTRKVNGVEISGDGPVPGGSKIEFSAAGTDPNNDVLFYKWRFSQPSPLVPNPVYLWGPKVVYDTTGYSVAGSVQGQLAVIDRLGAVLTVVLPSTNIS